ncbi:spermidine/putrescine import ATP-binding protein PotA [Polycladomyces abyssicola]|uniref:Spermidine/putrescine import ATP-binding protein PotA n=1 Tax=Polycladomyces abyssicola TaxID=1125966 RepID=A0A8D5UFT9_9BACL|nr:spermidine/putrescine import ATP-binding protein PotA [Polycladomyces abyssicola]
MNTIVELQKVEKGFGNDLVVKGIDLNVKRGEFLTILGPSGCGKTTTLRMIAGFEEPDAGQILLEGQNVVGIPPYKRDVNTVFQSYALFPHMTVNENIAYGLKMKGVSKSEITTRVKEALRLVQLESFGDRKPRQLSGGQQQRVAVARALVNNPKVILLDEPLGALDLKLRKQMQMELKHLQQKLEITFIYVTHDQEEALTISDRIAVMNEGTIEQIASPKEIYERPQTKFVADFIGDTNLLEVKITDMKENSLVLDFYGFKVGGKLGINQNVSDSMYLSIRPERVQLVKETPDLSYSLPGVVEETIFVGSFIRTIVQLAKGDRIVVMTPSQGKQIFQSGERVWVTWREEDGIVIGA